MTVARLLLVHFLAAIVVGSIALASPVAALASGPSPVEVIRAAAFPPNPQYLSEPSVAATPNGDVVVAYAEKASANATTSENRLAWRAPYGSSAQGSQGAGVVTVPLGSPGVTGVPTPRVAALPSGGVVAAWRDQFGLWIQLWTSIWQPSAAQRLTTAAPFDYADGDVALAVDGAGRAYVAWNEGSAPDAERLAIRAPDGTITGPLTLATDQFAYEVPRIAVRPDGGGMATWSRLVTSPLSSDVRARAFTTTGVSGPVMTLASATGSTASSGAQDAAVAVEPVGNRSLVTWFQSVTPAGGTAQSTVFASIIAGNGTVTGPVQLSADGSDAGPPRAAGVSDGTLLVAYQQGSYPRFRGFASGSSTPAAAGTISGPTTTSLVSLNVAGASAPLALVTSTDAGGRAVPYVSGTFPYTLSYANTQLGTLPVTGAGVQRPTAAVDASGDIFSAFLRDAGGGAIDVDLGISDGARPTVDRATVPTDGVVGAAISVLGSGSDVVGPVTMSWTFGDGSAEVAGNSAKHTYAGPGLYAATAKATDGAGQTTKETHYINVAAAPAVQQPTVTNPTETSPGAGGSSTAGGTTGAAPGSGGGTGRGGSATPTGVGGAGKHDQAMAAVPAFKVAMVARGTKVIGLVGVGLPPGARIVVLCRKGCGRAGATLGSARATKKGERPRVTRRLKAGAVIEVRVSVDGKQGRYARFVILKRSPFSRRIGDGCLSAAAKAVTC